MVELPAGDEAALAAARDQRRDRQGLELGTGAGSGLLFRRHRQDKPGFLAGRWIEFLHRPESATLDEGWARGRKRERTPAL